jgi:hypothetical protein
VRSPGRRTFADIVGQPPSEFRGTPAMDTALALDTVPSCFVKTWTRPASFGEAT